MRVVPLQNEFVGMMRDIPRDRLPDGFCWQMTDLIPSQLDAPAAKRGGWVYASPALSSIHTDAVATVGGIYAEFAAGAQNIAISGTAGGVCKAALVTDASTASDLGSVGGPSQNPVFYREKVIFTNNDGASAVKKYTGSGSVANLSGSPPAGVFARVYKDRLILARTAANDQRLFFSAAGDPESWDTTNRWIDVSSAITGIWPLRNAILVFRNSSIDRVRGEIPPPNTDMVKDENMFTTGMEASFNRSMAGDQERVVFANASGVYMTDGAGIIDLTDRGAMKSYWSEKISTLGTTPTATGGIFNNMYFVTLYQHGAWPITSGTTLVCDLTNTGRPEWFEISNVLSTAYWSRTTKKEELYWGSLEVPRVNTISDMFFPASGVKNDADGTAVAPVLEFPFYRAGGGLKRWGHALVAYDMRDAASDNPVLTLSYVTEPEGTSYTNVTDIAGAAATLPETTRFTEVRRLINKESDGIGLKIAQTNASSVTKIWGVNAEVEPLSRTALRQ